MKFLNLITLAMLIMALVISLSATPSQEEEETQLYNNNNEEDASTYDYLNDETVDIPSPETEQQISLRGASRLLAQKPRPTVMTCDKYPRVCRANGSPGPDCCKKKCVNVMTDRLNCGLCGRKCKYSEICCKGGCVNPSSNKRHCGGCNNRCKKWNSCSYGMCSYA